MPKVQECAWINSFSPFASRLVSNTCPSYQHSLSQEHLMLLVAQSVEFHT